MLYEDVDEPDFEVLNHMRALNQISEKSNRPYMVDLPIHGKPLTIRLIPAHVYQSKP